MPPKFEGDADGDVPPCSIMSSITALERWEKQKNERHGNKRKAPCACQYFHGKVPNTHVCTKIWTSQKVGCLTWFKLLFRFR